ncbi:MAG: hypothetical protein HYY23_19205, partial [Verrucomicrobia bacterium]|nr:hypothetical protein [Verrucomicrobiota bacterium]
MRSLCRSIPACVDRQPDPHRQTRRFGQRVLSGVRALLAVSALAALAVSNHSGAQTLTPVNIALTPGGWGEVKAVANGYVVGSAFAANGERHAYRWSAASQTIRDLNPPGVTGSTATGVNSSGEVTGFYVDPADPDNGDPPFIACYWAADGTFTSLGVRLPWYPTILIADNGIIGATDRTGHVLRGTRSGVWQDLGTVSGSSGDPWLTGINARGDFIGNASGIRGDYSGSRGFVALASSTTLTILQSPGTTSGPPFAYQNEGERNIQLNGINDNGVVVGTYWDFRSRYYTNYGTDAYHNSHAFKWTAEGEFVDLGQLGTYPVPGVNQPNYRSFFASATAINNAGTIVGYSSTSNGGGAPFIYDSTTGTMVQLAGAGNDFGPVAINDNGIVAGSAGGQAYASVVIAGVRTYIVPVFAPQYNGTPGLPLMKGSTFASHGYPNDFSVQRAWAMGLPSAPPPATPPVIFTRTTATAEAWKKYTVSFIPTQSGDYTLSFNVLAGGPSGDNSILVDAVKVATGATTLLTDGFETPALPLNGYSLAAAGTATIGNWVFANYSGILDGSPPNWGLDGQGLGSADGTTQYATLRAVAGTLSTMKPLNTLTLVAGQTYT